MVAGHVASAAGRPGRGSVKIGHALVATAVLLAVIGVVNRGEIAQLTELWWTSGSYGHGLLVVPVSVFLIWSKREQLASLTPTPNAWPLLLAVLLTVVWLAADIADVMVIKQLCIVGLLMSVVWVVLGGRFLRALAFPLAYLLTAVPIWAVLIPPLRDVTAVAAARIVRSFSVPVYVEGNFIQIPVGTFEIADVCAGLRFFLAGLALATLYAYLNFRSWRRGAVFVAVAVLWVIVFNWIRVATVIIIGHLGGMQHPLVQDHYSVGWVLFVVAMVPLALLGSWMQGNARGVAAPVRESTPPTAVKTELASRRLFLLTLCCALVVLSGPVTARLTEPSSTFSHEPIVLPDTVAGWRKSGQHNALGSRFVGSRWEAAASYDDGEHSVDVYLAFYGYQSQGAELINHRNRLFDRDLWRLSERRIRRIDSAAAGQRRAGEMLLYQGVPQRYKLVRYWYVVGGRETDNRVGAKLLQVLGTLTGRPESMAVVLSTDRGDDAASAEQVLDRFGESVAPTLTGRFF